MALNTILRLQRCSNNVTFKVSRTCSQFIRGYAVAPEASSSKEELVLNYIEKENQGKIAVMAFNRPAAKNAFSKSIVFSLIEYLETLRFDKDVRVLIIRSMVPGIFCAGADLKERLKMKPEEVAPLVSKMRGVLTNVETLPMPVIAALDGAALGGGELKQLKVEVNLSLYQTRFILRLGVSLSL
jgi:methylglutaconyl-CoA hydratase